MKTIFRTILALILCAMPCVSFAQTATVLANDWGRTSEESARKAKLAGIRTVLAEFVSTNKNILDNNRFADDVIDGKAGIIESCNQLYTDDFYADSIYTFAEMKINVAKLREFTSAHGQNADLSNNAISNKKLITLNYDSRRECIQSLFWLRLFKLFSGLNKTFIRYNNLKEERDENECKLEFYAYPSKKAFMFEYETRKALNCLMPSKEVLDSYEKEDLLKIIIGGENKSFDRPTINMENGHPYYYNTDKLENLFTQKLYYNKTEIDIVNEAFDAVIDNLGTTNALYGNGKQSPIIAVLDDGTRVPLDSDSFDSARIHYNYERTRSHPKFQTLTEALNQIDFSTFGVFSVTISMPKEGTDSFKMLYKGQHIFDYERIFKKKTKDNFLPRVQRFELENQLSRKTSTIEEIERRRQEVEDILRQYR